MLEIACLVSAGIKSPKNDDKAAVNTELISEGSYSETCEKKGLFVVCDGVGGEAFGYEAAEITTKIFSAITNSEITIDVIKENIKKANEAVLSAQKKDTAHSRMCTTIAGLYINDNNFIAFNVGDSRIYRYRNPYIMQLSTDHSVWQEQISLGLKPRQEHKSTITRYIGGTSYEPAIVDGKDKCYMNDIFVICSDGVWGVLEHDDFENALSIDKPLNEICNILIELSLQKGSDDNLSIIIVRRK